MVSPVAQIILFFCWSWFSAPGSGSTSASAPCFLSLLFLVLVLLGADLGPGSGACWLDSEPNWVSSDL